MTVIPKTFFIHCLLKANYEEKKWQGIIIPRGGFITSIGHLAIELGFSPSHQLLS